MLFLSLAFFHLTPSSVAFHVGAVCMIKCEVRTFMQMDTAWNVGWNFLLDFFIVWIVWTGHIFLPIHTPAEKYRIKLELEEVEWPFVSAALTLPALGVFCFLEGLMWRNQNLTHHHPLPHFFRATKPCTFAQNYCRGIHDPKSPPGDLAVIFPEPVHLDPTPHLGMTQLHLYIPQEALWRYSDHE